MELPIALPENNNWLTTTALGAATDNGLSNKLVVHEQTLEMAALHCLRALAHPCKKIPNMGT